MHSSGAHNSPSVHYPRGDASRALERIAPLLIPFSWLYGAGVATARRVRTIDAEPPRGGPHVISIGNLEVGGSGKTPTCIYLLERLAAQGVVSAYVSRGYASRAERGDGVTVIAPEGEPVRPVPGVRLLDRHDPGLAAEVGDEAAVVALRCPQAALLVGRHKREAVALCARLFGASVVVLDDAFQSWAVHRDVDIVLVSDPVAVASGRLLPAGRLREEVDALARANAVVVPEASMAAASRLRPHLAPGTPVLGLERRIDLPAGVSGAVGAVTALARPEGPEGMLKERGLDLKLCVRFPDHHHYDAGDIDTIQRLSERHRLDTLIVTEKDHVKLRHLDGVAALALQVARLDVAFSDVGVIDEMLKPRHKAAASA